MAAPARAAAAPASTAGRSGCGAPPRPRRAAPRAPPRAAAPPEAASGGLASFGAGLGPTATAPPAGEAAPAAAAAAAAEWSDDFELESEAGVDYSLLQKELKAGNWELADNEHRRLLCELAGEEAEERKWVYFTEIAPIPVQDLQMLDKLWMTYSKGRYGFSVQKKIWKGVKCRWANFFKKIDWVQGENNAYRKWPEEFKWEESAAEGHLPLTNALRGTQLFEAIMTHPAFDDSAQKAAIKKEQTEDNAPGSYL